MARLKPIDLLRSCRSESSLISFFNNLWDYNYEYGAQGDGHDNNDDNADDDIIGNADNANEDIIGDADSANGESDMHELTVTHGHMVDSYIALARRMAFGLSLNVDFPHPSSSWRSLPESATVHPHYVVSHYIVFWRNGFTVNDGPLRDLDDPDSDHFFQCLKSDRVPAEFEPFDRCVDVYGEYVCSCILRNENHPADPERFYRTFVDETRPTTSLQLMFSDHTRRDVRFNLHHTVADIRAYFDAAKPEENELYHLLNVIPPNRYRELYNPDETIQHAGLDNSIIEQGRY